MITSIPSAAYFKGWAIPGPRISTPLEGAEALCPKSDESLDALCGHFRIFQLKKGHRFSTDDMLVAWYGTSWCPTASWVLDLGSGIGSVGMTAAWRLPGCKVVSVEAQEISVSLARRSVQLNGLSHRYEIRQGDLRDPLVFQPHEQFDLVLGSPPYFPLQSGILSDHPQKIACRFETRGSIHDYCQTAAAHLSPGGVFACIFPMQPQEQAERVHLAAQSTGMSLVRCRPIIFKEGEAPLLCLYAMMKSEHLPEPFRSQTWSEPALIIRTADGQTHPEYGAVKLAMGLPPR